MKISEVTVLAGRVIIDVAYISEVIVWITTIVDAGSVMVMGVPEIIVVTVTGGTVIISSEVSVVTVQLAPFKD